MCNITKTCSKCDKIFPATLEHFYKEKVNSYGELLLKGRCKKCCRPPKEKERENSKIYYDKHSRDICKKKTKNYALKKHGIQILN